MAGDVLLNDEGVVLQGTVKVASDQPGQKSRLDVQHIFATNLHVKSILSGKETSVSGSDMTTGDITAKSINTEAMNAKSINTEVMSAQSINSTSLTGQQIALGRAPVPSSDPADVGQFFDFMGISGGEIQFTKFTFVPTPTFLSPTIVEVLPVCAQIRGLLADVAALKVQVEELLKKT